MNPSNAPAASVTEAGKILLLHPLKWFGIVTAELKRVAAYSQYMMVEGTLRREWLHEGPPELLQLATLCEELRPESLYARYASKKVFRRMEDFWATEETAVRTHVKRMADMRLVKAVRLAEALHIPVLYASDENSPLHISDRLHLDESAVVTPVMNFRRHEGGIAYRLQLRIGGRLIAQPSDHHVVVLGHELGMFVLDDCIYCLGDAFNGKLLLPFVSKPVVEIPQRMENDYFHRFILKNMTRAEISAEGFDITDISQPPRPCLAFETSIDGSRLLSLRFSYGTMDYIPDSKANGRVTLVEEEGGFRFIRQLRDRQREHEQLETLRRMAGFSARGELRFQSLAVLIGWLREHAPGLRAQGFDVVQPSDHIYYIGPLSVEQSDTWHGDWLQTDVTVVIERPDAQNAHPSDSPAGTPRHGPLRLPFRDLRDTILRGEREYMLPTGELLLIPQEWLKRYSSLLLTGMVKGSGFQRHRSQVDSIDPGRSQPDATSPQPLSGASGVQACHQVLPPQMGHRSGADAVLLRPYQQAGFQWLWQHFMAQTGCCLSDEMGLGKTVQTIALLLKYKEMAAASSSDRQPLPGMLFSYEEMQGRSGTDVASPLPTAFDFHTSLVLAPASVVHNWLHELARFAPALSVLDYTGDAASRQEKRRALMRWDVVLTSYRTLLNDIGHLERRQFGIVVFDECQAFKNQASQVHHAVTRLKCLHSMALSGTPVVNNLTELWSLFSVLNPNLLGDFASFRKSFISPIAAQLEDSRSELLRRMIAPYFLRRTKEEVAGDLPERQDEVVLCQMTQEQASSYAEELSKARNEWLEAASTTLLPHSGLSQGERPSGEETARGSTGGRGRQAIAMMAALQRLRHIANGEGKMSVVFEHLENLRQSSHKVLIFSEYVSMLSRVGREMEQRGWSYDLLTGQTQQREQVIAHFQREQSCQFFLISLKAGGEGLNLTAADYVFILDPWWNHAAEEQAIARAHRIGQHRSVFVYRFVTANTLEEQILTLQDRKQSLIDSVMPFIL